jgi:hypothetical protein
MIGVGGKKGMGLYCTSLVLKALWMNESMKNDEFWW